MIAVSRLLKSVTVPFDSTRSPKTEDQEADTDIKDRMNLVTKSTFQKENTSSSPFSAHQNRK
jgi:hypothetical protein